MANIANYNGAVKIESVMYHSDVSSQDITMLVKEINIHSSLNITSSFAQITVVDRNNWLEKIAFAPGDVVSFVLSHNELGSYEYRYNIKMIEGITNAQSAIMYNLKCVTSIEYKSISQRISKAYSGKPSDIFKAFAKDNLDEGVRFIEESSQNISFIAPGWSPLEITNHIARHSTTKTGNSRMKCFQDSHQLWVFSSMKGLQENQGEILTYRYFSNAGATEPEKMLLTIIQLRFLNSFDLKTELLEGNVKNTFMDFDPNSKTASIKSNTYHDTYKKNALNEVSIWKTESLSQGNFVYRNIPENVGTPRYTPMDQSNDDFEFSKAQQIEIVVPGNPIVDMGHIVNIEIPTMEPNNTKVVELNNMWSGKYYVVAKRDVVKMDGHMMVLRLAKDSFRRGR